MFLFHSVGLSLVVFYWISSILLCCWFSTFLCRFFSFCCWFLYLLLLYYGPFPFLTFPLTLFLRLRLLSCVWHSWLCFLLSLYSLQLIYFLCCSIRSLSMFLNWLLLLLGPGLSCLSVPEVSSRFGIVLVSLFVSRVCSISINDNVIIKQYENDSNTVDYEMI